MVPGVFVGATRKAHSAGGGPKAARWLLSWPLSPAPAASPAAQLLMRAQPKGGDPASLLRQPGEHAAKGQGQPSLSSSFFLLEQSETSRPTWDTVAVLTWLDCGPAVLLWPTAAALMAAAFWLPLPVD